MTFRVPAPAPTPTPTPPTEPAPSPPEGGPPRPRPADGWSPATAPGEPERVPPDIEPDAEPGGGVLLDGIVKRYGAQTVLDMPRLHVPEGSFTVMVGPSGCGKSTALRIVAGLETADAGRVALDGRDVTNVPPGRRGVSMVFQDFALYPHLTVEDNIAFSLRLEAKHNRRGGPSRAEISRRVTDTCEMLGLADLRGRRPGQLSGGERQRVGLARAIVRRPAVLLLDEPLSALDAQLRQHARAELIRLHRELGNTVILVTHDQLEALSMGTHLVVMNAGGIAQVGTPAEVYRRPADTFVATFVGSPAMNLHEAPNGPDQAAGGPRAVRLGWRPGDGVLTAPDGEEPAGLGLTLDGTVDVIEFTGDGSVVHCVGAAGRWSVAARSGVPLTVGQRIRTRVAAADLHRFDPESGRRLPDVDSEPRPGGA